MKRKVISNEENDNTRDNKIEKINSDLRRLKKTLKEHGYPNKLISAIETRALRSGRKQTGVFKSNRQSRWALVHDHPEYGTDPQYGTEKDCKTILIRLLLQTLEFVSAPRIKDETISQLFAEYFGRKLDPDTYRDSLLLEHLDFADCAMKRRIPGTDTLTSTSGTRIHNVFQNMFLPMSVGELFAAT
jgi:hypothetical protein